MYKGKIQKFKPSLTEEYEIRDSRISKEIDSPIDLTILPNKVVATTALDADWNGEWRNERQPSSIDIDMDGVTCKFYKIWDNLPSVLEKTATESQTEWEARLYDKLWDGLYTLRIKSGIDISSIYKECSKEEYQANKDTTKVYYTYNDNLYHIYFGDGWHDYTSYQLGEIFNKIYELHPEMFDSGEFDINSVKKNLYDICADLYSSGGVESDQADVEAFITDMYNQGKENFSFMTEDEGKSYYTAFAPIGENFQMLLIQVSEEVDFLEMVHLTKGWYFAPFCLYGISSILDYSEISLCYLDTIKQLDESYLPSSLTKSVNELVLKSKETTLTLSLGLSIDITAMSGDEIGEYNLYLLNEDGSFSDNKADWYKLNTYWKNGYNFKIGNTRMTILGLEQTNKNSYTLLNMLNDEYGSGVRDIYSPLQFLIGIKDSDGLNILTLTVPLGYGQEYFETAATSNIPQDRIGKVCINSSPSSDKSDYYIASYYDNTENTYKWFSFKEEMGGLKNKISQIQITEMDLPFRIEQPTNTIGLPNGTHAADIENSNSTLIYYEGNNPIVKIGKGAERTVTQYFSSGLWNQYNIFPFSQMDVSMGVGTFGFQQISGSSNYELYQLRNLTGTAIPDSVSGWTKVKSTDETFEIGGGLYSFQITGLTMPANGFVNCINGGTVPTENGTGYFNTKGIYITQNGATRSIAGLKASYYPYSFYYWVEEVLDDGTLRKTKKTVTMTYNTDGDRGKQNYSISSTSIDYAALPSTATLEANSTYNLVVSTSTTGAATYKWVKG